MNILRLLSVVFFLSFFVGVNTSNAQCNSSGGCVNPKKTEVKLNGKKDAYTKGFFSTEFSMTQTKAYVSSKFDLNLLDMNASSGVSAGVFYNAKISRFVGLKAGVEMGTQQFQYTFVQNAQGTPGLITTQYVAAPITMENRFEVANGTWVSFEYGGAVHFNKSEAPEISYERILGEYPELTQTITVGEVDPVTFYAIGGFKLNHVLNNGQILSAGVKRNFGFSDMMTATIQDPVDYKNRGFATDGSMWQFSLGFSLGGNK